MSWLATFPGMCPPPGPTLAVPCPASVSPAPRAAAALTRGAHVKEQRQEQPHGPACLGSVPGEHLPGDRPPPVPSRDWRLRARANCFPFVEIYFP